MVNKRNHHVTRSLSAAAAAAATAATTTPLGPLKWLLRLENLTYRMGAIPTFVHLFRGINRVKAAWIDVGRGSANAALVEESADEYRRPVAGRSLAKVSGLRVSTNRPKRVRHC